MDCTSKSALHTTVVTYGIMTINRKLCSGSNSSTYNIFQICYYIYKIFLWVCLILNKIINLFIAQKTCDPP